MKQWLIILFIVPMLLLAACNHIEIETDEKIGAPENNAIPIKGTWIIEKSISLAKEDTEGKKQDKWLGEKAEFGKDYVFFAQELCEHPQYKIKNVDAGYYFLYTYKADAGKLGIKSAKVDVITITSGDKLFYEFVRIDASQLILSMGNRMLYLKKLSDELEENKAPTGGRQGSAENSQNKMEAFRYHSGVVLGLRSLKESGFDKSKLPGQNGERVFYKTLWISADYKRLRPVLEMDNLFLPRRNGFWKVGVTREVQTNGLNDSLFAYPVDNEININNINDNASLISSTSKKSILFIGNDYMALEYTVQEKDREAFHRLKVLPVDNIESNKGVKISEILGESGKEAMFHAAQAYFSAQNKENRDGVESTPDEESFTITRKNGHWMMQGRLNARAKRFMDHDADFNIPVIPPKNMISYDDLAVSWNVIKSKVPTALDAYTSPNKDIAVIICKNVIYIYTINNGDLSHKPANQIPIQEGAMVVMAEWAVGDYVNMWEESFLNELN
ncbi:hypothetical protein [Petroclostridium sp. X23]|uniref:hypothetical protein n=1 Tax=Petroclostridium sp. X23 TaxID=3045146 RepID=UPI0024AE2003|nr:hypothetical protein [Petroclostridium sp. X23]WHH58628.1 hypothetical protein QKW49_23000 [Petroclostridium sp. X23]